MHAVADCLPVSTQLRETEVCQTVGGLTQELFGAQICVTDEPPCSDSSTKALSAAVLVVAAAESFREHVPAQSAYAAPHKAYALRHVKYSRTRESAPVSF